MDIDLMIYVVMSVIAGLTSYVSNMPIYKHNKDRKKQLQEESEKKFYEALKDLQTIAKKLDSKADEGQN